MQHFPSARPPPAAAPPTGWERARRPPEPRQYRRLTHAHAAATGGYPARGSGTKLKYGLEPVQAKPVTTDGSQHHCRTFRPADRCPITAKTRATCDPHPADAREETQLSHPTAAPRSGEWILKCELVLADLGHPERTEVADRRAQTQRCSASWRVPPSYFHGDELQVEALEVDRADTPWCRSCEGLH